MTHNPDLPDAGEGMCCYGAINGPGHCTCWRPVCDTEQKPIQQGAAAQRRRMCSDCAFLPGSPERSGDPRFSHSGPIELQELVDSGKAFACHQGMRRVLKLVHEPTGVEHVVGDGGYEPAVAGGMAFKADGSPADLCAGVLAARRAGGAK